MQMLKRVEKYASIMLICGFCLYVFLGISIALEDTLFKNLFLPFAAISVAPIVITVLLSFVRITALYSKSKDSKQKQYYMRKVYPTYQETVYLFKDCIQHRYMSRQDILEFKSLLNEALGKNTSKYSGYSFSNDAHEIYTKLKDTHISEQYMYVLRSFVAKIHYKPITHRINMNKTNINAIESTPKVTEETKPITA